MTQNIEATETVKTYRCPSCDSKDRFGIVEKVANASEMQSGDVEVKLGGLIKSAHFMTVLALSDDNKKCAAELAICSKCGTVYAWRTRKAEEGSNILSLAGFSPGRMTGVNIEMSDYQK